MEETKKTLLERIVEQEAQKIVQAIEQAIKDDAIIVPCKVASSAVLIDNVFVLTNEYDKSCSIVLNFKSDEVFAQYMKIRRINLEMQKQEIEEQLKELEQ